MWDFLTIVFLIAVVVFVGIRADEGDNVINQLQECKTELQVYQEINNELIKRIE